MVNTKRLLSTRAASYSSVKATIPQKERDEEAEAIEEVESHDEVMEVTEITDFKPTTEVEEENTPNSPPVIKLADLCSVDDE